MPVLPQNNDNFTAQIMLVIVFQVWPLEEKKKQLNTKALFLSDASKFIFTN